MGSKTKRNPYAIIAKMTPPQIVPDKRQKKKEREQMKLCARATVVHNGVWQQ